MMDINLVIANNILETMRKQGRKQVELADGLGILKQTMSKMLNGGRTISAAELKQIADFLHVTTDSLMRLPSAAEDTDVIHTFMGRVETTEAQEALEVADEVSDLILFHSRVRKKSREMTEVREERQAERAG